MPERYVSKRDPWWHRITTDLRVYLVVIAGLSLYSVVLGTAARQKAADSIQAVVNCTTAHHACYDNGQRSQGAAIAAIQRANVYANYCAVRIAQSRKAITVPAISKCVSDLLAQDARH